jgi:hypothetical protein
MVAGAMAAFSVKIFIWRWMLGGGVEGGGELVGASELQNEQWHEVDGGANS